MSDTLKNFKHKTPLPLRQELASALRKAILTGELLQGERLIETDLAELLGVSRMPVREALRMLENEGLVHHIPRIGLVVTKFTEKDIKEIYAIREALEAYAIVLVAKNITSEEIEELERYCNASEKAAEENDFDALCLAMEKYNNRIYASCAMERMITIINKYQEYLRYFRMKSMKSITRSSQAMQEHREIVSALKSRDADHAVEIIHQHLQNSLKAYLKTLKENNLE
jgi:DNA-binding GntR family transcriptional regulator